MPGVWSALSHNEGAAVVFHSPRACAHIARQMNLYNHFRYLSRQQLKLGEPKAQLFVSNLTDRQAVFGGGQQLRDCLDALVEKHRPQYVVIANSCVAGVTGEDTRAVAKEAEEYWGIPIMAVDGHGFLDGDYYSGFFQAGQLLIERFMKKQDRQPGTVTLIADRGHPDSQAVRELRQLLQHFKLRVHAYFPSYASVHELEQVSASELTVIMGGSKRGYPWLKKLAQTLKERFEIPFVDCDYPVGWQATQKWIAAVGAAIDEPALAGEVERAQELRLKKQFEAAGGILRGKKIVFCIGRPVDFFNPEWLLELAAMTDAQVLKIILLDSLSLEAKQAVKERLQAFYPPGLIEESEQGLAQSGADLVVTTHELLDEKVRQMVLPLLPTPGVAGLVEFLEKAGRLVARYGQRGGVVYG